MLIVLASLGLIRRHRPLNIATSTNRHVRTAPPSSAAAPPRHATAIFQRPRSAAIPMLFDCCLLVPMLIVLASLGLIQHHAENSANTSTGTVQFQYWASIGAHTSTGTAGMVFISSMGTCQVPVPVLALPRWHTFPVWALAKCPYQYWHASLPTLANIRCRY
jgi:hypothetical protein